MWGSWAPERPWDLEGAAEDVMRLSLEKLRCVGLGTRGWSTDYAAQEPEQKRMVGVDEEPGPRLFTNGNQG